MGWIGMGDEARVCIDGGGGGWPDVGGGGCLSSEITTNQACAPFNFAILLSLASID